MAPVVDARQPVPTVTDTTTRTTTVTTTGTGTTLTGTSTTTVTDFGKKSVFGSVVLTLNVATPLKELVRKVKKAVVRQLEKRDTKQAKVLGTVIVESLQKCGLRVQRKVEVPIVIRAANTAYCKKQKPGWCLLTALGLNDLAQRRGYTARRLQGAGAETFVELEGFSMHSVEEDVDGINEIVSADFGPAVTTALTQELGVSDSLGLTASVSGIQQYARAVVSYSTDENRPAETEDLLKSVPTSTLVEALQESDDLDAITGTPVVDLCLNRDCSGHGTCSEGTCRCAAGWWGINCALAADVPSVQPFSVDVDLADDWVPILLTLSAIAFCMCWVIPCAIIYYRWKKGEPEEDNNKKEEDVEEGSNEEVESDVYHYRPETEDTTFI